MLGPALGQSQQRRADPDVLVIGALCWSPFALWPAAARAALETEARKAAARCVSLRASVLPFGALCIAARVRASLWRAVYRCARPCFPLTLWRITLYAAKAWKGSSGLSYKQISAQRKVVAKRARVVGVPSPCGFEGRSREGEGRAGRGLTQKCGLQARW